MPPSASAFRSPSGCSTCRTSRIPALLVLGAYGAYLLGDVRPGSVAGRASPDAGVLPRSASPLYRFYHADLREARQRRRPARARVLLRRRVHRRSGADPELRRGPAHGARPLTSARAFELGDMRIPMRMLVAFGVALVLIAGARALSVADVHRPRDQGRGAGRDRAGADGRRPGAHQAMGLRHRHRHCALAGALLIIVARSSRARPRSISAAPSASSCWRAWAACRARWSPASSWASPRASCSPRSAHPGRPRSPSALLLLVLAVRPAGPVRALMMDALDSASGSARRSVVALACRHGADRRATNTVFFAGYVVLQFIVLATAWNILGGYAGYVNFGSGAFFGVGAYTAVAPDQGLRGAAARADRGGGAASARLLGFAIGAADLAPARHLLLDRHGRDRHHLRDPRASTGISSAAPAACSSCSRRRRRSSRPTRRCCSSSMALLAVLVASRWRATSRSPWIGRGLRAIRDDEEAAESVGRSDAEAETVRLRALRRADGRCRRAVSALHEFIEPAVGLQPELRGVGARHADHRRHRELGRPGDRRGPARRPRSRSSP